MLDFSKNAVFNLKKIPDSDMNKNVNCLLIENESVIGVYKTIRDQVVFTNKRIITIDVQGIMGKRQEFFTLPYSKIQYFGVQTVGFAELIPDSELDLFFTNGMKAVFEFKGQCDILEIGKTISRFTL